MTKFFMFLSVITLFSVLSACQLGISTADKSVTVFSERHYDTDRDLYKRFTEVTGIEVNLIRDGADQLITKLSNEGEDSLADVLIIADAGRLQRAKEGNLLQAVHSDIIDANVPSHLKDEDHMWFGLTLRARVLVYDPARVNKADLSTYEALTQPQWFGRIVTRTSTNIYNQSLMASFIEIHGEQAAEAFAKGLVNNFARDPQGNDRDQAKAVAEGIADVAIMNTYYIGRMLNSTDQYEREVANQLAVFFPNQETTGTHVNVSAAGVTKYAPNSEYGIQLIEFLTSEEAQESYASANYEYPVNQAVQLDPLLLSWGTFIAQDIPLSALGRHSVKASMVMDRVGWR